MPPTLFVLDVPHALQSTPHHAAVYGSNDSLIWKHKNDGAEAVRLIRLEDMPRVPVAWPEEFNFLRVDVGR